MGTVQSELHSSVLKELGNIGAGHAATALADLMGRNFGLTEPHVETISVHPEILDSRTNDREVAALQMTVYGDAPAEMLIVFDRADAINFVHRFTHDQATESELDPAIFESALREIANIIGGSYLTAIVDLIGVELLPSTPKLRYGKMSEVLSEVIVEAEPSNDQEAHCIQNGFINEHGAIHVELMLIPHDGSMGSYLQAFGISG